TLGLGAQMADLPQIDALCQVLLNLYAVVQNGQLAVSERFFDAVEQGHEALVGMMDEVAAGLQVSAQPALVARLEALLAEANTSPVTYEQLVFSTPEGSAENKAEAEAEAEAEAGADTETAHRGS